MDIFQSYGTSFNAEENGREFENGDAVFVIARSGNRQYSAMLATQYAQHKHTLDQKDTPEAVEAANSRSEKIMVSVMSKAILLGWSGNVLYKGQPLAYSTFNAALLLGHKDFRNWVNGKSDDFKNYLESVKEEDEKNSVTSTTGSLPGVAA